VRSISSCATNSARPHVIAGPSGSASGRSAEPSISTIRSAPAQTYATQAPVGSGRGSMTGAAAGSSRVLPMARSVTNSRLDSGNAAVVTASSVAYCTIPAAPVLVRSRRARSCADSSSSPPASRAFGSATSRSAVTSASRSSTHRHVVRSSPARERRKTTRLPSGATVYARGAPRVNFWVRAACRGNDST
jgi:hypothetical protein